MREEIFAGSTWHAAYEPQRAVRTARHKYIRRWGERLTPVLANTDDGPSKDLLLRNGWAEREIAKEQLYDLLFDPNEAQQPGRAIPPTRRCWPTCADASSGGCATPTIRCSRATSTRRRASRSTCPTSCSATEPTTHIG